MEEELDRLKDKAPASGSGGDPGLLGDRVAKLHNDALALDNTTNNIVKALEGNRATPHERNAIHCLMRKLHE